MTLPLVVGHGFGYVAVRRYGLRYGTAALHPAQARAAPAHGARPGEMS